MKYWLGLIFLLTALPAQAATTKPAWEVSGWIPYWRAATGTMEAMNHLGAFKELDIFGYTVKNDGSLNDAGNFREEPWTSLIAAAKAKKIRVIATVMTANSQGLDTILRSPTKRKAHIDAIVKTIWDNHFDGVDIDYEGKMAATRPHFSLFLKELYKAIGQKWVMCTIEARTPLDSRYDTIPTDIEYANDYTAINKYCDRVRLMTYDQGSIDIKLNRVAAGPYAPVADPAWVEKVVKLATQTISPRKLVVGVATYGYEYQVTPLTMGYRYDLLWNFNPRYGWDTAQQFSLTPGRNQADELSFTYHPTSTPATANVTDPSLSNNDLLPSTSVSQNNNLNIFDRRPFNLVWWSDGQAIADKIKLAKRLGLRGIAIFKIDGGGDPALWDVLRQK